MTCETGTFLLMRDNCLHTHTTPMRGRFSACLLELELHVKLELSDLSLINRNLAEFVGVPLSTIDRAAVKGRLRTMQIGTQGETRVVRISDVQKWKDENYRPQNPTE